MCRVGIAMFAAGLLTLAGNTAAWAQNDTFRLGSSSSGAAAAVSGGTDTELVHGRGGYRGHYWGGHSYYRPYWGGYGYASYYYRPAYYRPAYYRPYYYGPVVYQPYYYAAPAYYPISGQADVPATLAQLPAPQQATSQYRPTTARPQVLPMPAIVPQQPGGLQTFPYDGGPQVPLPTPQVDPASGPRPTVPLQGKIVSRPQETTGGTTPLFTVSLSTYGQTVTLGTPRSYTYPAYGDQALPAVRKQAK
jgi:hypothetical protein